MTRELMLAGLGLLLLAPAQPARHRLAWMAASRLPAVAAAPARFNLPRRYSAALAVGTAMVACGLLAGPVPAGLTGLTAAVLTRCRQQLSREREASTEQGRLAELVSALAAEHAAGASLGSALLLVAEDAGVWQPALSRAGRLAATGGEPAVALGGQARLVPLAVGLALAARTGAAVAEVLARVQADLRAEQGSRRAVAEAVAGPRSSAALLGVLPLIGLAMGAALGARPLHVLTRTPAGLAALTVGVLLELAGLLWTLRLTR